MPCFPPCKFLPTKQSDNQLKDFKGASNDGCSYETYASFECLCHTLAERILPATRTSQNDRVTAMVPVVPARLADSKKINGKCYGSSLYGASPGLSRFNSTNQQNRPWVVGTRQVLFVFHNFISSSTSNTQQEQSKMGLARIES